MSMSRASEYPESDDGMTTEHPAGRSWTKIICAGLSVGAVAAVGGVAAGGGFTKLNAAGAVPSNQAEAVVQSNQAEAVDDQGADHFEKAPEGKGSKKETDPHYLYYGCASYYEAMSGNPYPEHPAGYMPDARWGGRKLRAGKGNKPPGAPPANPEPAGHWWHHAPKRGSLCPDKDCVHVSDVKDLLDATCAAIRDRTFVVPVCATNRPIVWDWDDGSLSLAFVDDTPHRGHGGHGGWHSARPEAPMFDTTMVMPPGSVDVLEHCNASPGSVPYLKYQCVGMADGRRSAEKHHRDRVLHPHGDDDGEYEPFAPIDYLADISSPACAIDFDRIRTTEWPGAPAGPRPCTGDGCVINPCLHMGCDDAGPSIPGLAGDILNDPSYPPGVDYDIKNPTPQGNIAFVIGFGFELEFDHFVFFNRYESGPMFYNLIGELALTNSVFMNNWYRLPGPVKARDRAEAGDSVKFGDRVEAGDRVSFEGDKKFFDFSPPLFQADPVIVLDFDVRDIFDESFGDTWTRKLRDGRLMGNAEMCDDPDLISINFFSKTTIADSYFAHNNGMLMWFRGDGIVKDNTFYGNSLNPYQLAGLSPGDTDISIGDLLDSMNGRRDGVDFRDARSAIGSNPWRDLGFIVWDEFTCVSSIVIDVGGHGGMGGDNIDEDAFKTINHFALSGNQLVAFDADPENGVPVSFQLVALRADWTNIAVGTSNITLGIIPLPLTALWLDNHGHALTLEENRFEDPNAALGNYVSGTNFAWDVWAYIICELTPAKQGCDESTFGGRSRHLTVSDKGARLGRKLLNKIQDSKNANGRRLDDATASDGGTTFKATDDGTYRAFDGFKANEGTYTALGGGIGAGTVPPGIFYGITSLLPLFSACNDGAAIVLRDFEFFEVVFLNYCSELREREMTPITGTNICAAGWKRRARNLGSRLEKQAEMVAQNMHKAAQQEDEHGRKLTGRVEEFIYQILIMLGLFMSEESGLLDFGPGRCIPFEGKVPDVFTPAYLSGEL